MNGFDLLRGIGEIDDDLIAEAYIEAPKVHSHIEWKKWGSAAACLLCVGAISIVAYRTHISSVPESASQLAESAAYDTVVEAVPQQETASASGEMQEAAQYDIAEAGDPEECNLQNAQQENAQSSPARDWSDYEIISEYPGEMDAIYCYAQPEQGSYFLYEYLSKTLSQNETADILSPYAYAVNISVFTYDDSDEAAGREVLGETAEEQQLLTQEYERLLEVGYDVHLSDSWQLSGIFTKEELKDFSVNDQYGYAIYFANEP